jgi:hypothetical protein
MNQREKPARRMLLQFVSLNPDIAVEEKIELQKKRKTNKNAPFC